MRAITSVFGVLYLPCDTGYGNKPDINLSVRHHVFIKTGKKEVQLAEVGPRFEMKRKHSLVLRTSSLFSYVSSLHLAYEIRLGTIEQGEADKEWVLAHYTRTAKKRRLL
jgi:U3 small nucleolar ribonucleoprotein protein IMP4